MYLCRYVNICLRNVNQYYGRKKPFRSELFSLSKLGRIGVKFNLISIQNNKKLFVAIVWEIFSLQSRCYPFVKNRFGYVGQSGKWEKSFFMKGESNIWKIWWLGLAYFNSLLPLYRNRPNGLVCKSIDWFLYNSNTGPNRKVDAWLR